MLQKIYIDRDLDNLEIKIRINPGPQRLRLGDLLKARIRIRIGLRRTGIGSSPRRPDPTGSDPQHWVISNLLASFSMYR
jgi:hypothetical protein